VVFATALAAFGSLSASSAKAQTTWTITVDVTSGNETPAYKVLSNPTGASDCSGTNPNPLPSHYILYICPNDKVEWKVKTTGKKGWLSIHQKDGFLMRNGVPIYWFHSREGGSADGGQSDAIIPASPLVYEYFVAVFDDNSTQSHLYAHDPKVIIGNGPPIELFDAECKKVAASFSDETKAKDARKICEEAERKLNNLLSQK